MPHDPSELRFLSQFFLLMHLQKVYLHIFYCALLSFILQVSLKYFVFCIVIRINVCNVTLSVVHAVIYDFMFA